jgi:DNA recombination protein RmuC
VITLFVALAAAILAGLLVWLWQERAQAGLRARADAAQTEINRLIAELQTTRQRGSESEVILSQTKVELATEKASASERIRSLQEAQEHLTTQFQALCAEALRHNNTAFLELARTSLGQFQQRAEGDLAARQHAIDALTKPLRESLERVDKKIAEIEDKRHTAYGALSEQLKSLNSAQLQLQTEAAKLSTALRSTSYVGSWGELQLRRVVELADMTNYCDFLEQESSGALRADLVVRLPNGQRIVIDAKSPVQSYRDAIDLPDAGAREIKLREHAAKIRGHIDALGAKNYWEQFQPAPEYVVLFVPGDHFLTAALQVDAELLERAVSRRVLLATPTTLIALLKAAAIGWRQESISQNAEEISALGRQLHDRLSTFTTHLEKLGRSLDATTKSYNAAVGALEGSVFPGARRFAELGAKGAKELTLPEPIETSVREIHRRE